MTTEKFFHELIRRRDGIFSSDLLITAIGYLDFFNWLNEHPSHFKGICESLELAERPVDVMLTFFCSLGFIDNVKDIYRVSNHGRTFLVKDSRYDLRGYFNSLRERPICHEILSVLKTNRPLNWANAPGGNEWAKAMSQEDFAESFTSAMDCRGTYLAPILAKRLRCEKYSRILDIAGASGVYSSALVKLYPHLHAAIIEKPPVHTLAEYAMKKQGLSKNISVIPMDMFADGWPGGYDIHLFSHVLHDWDFQDVQYLLEKSFNALEPGGMLVIHDAHINRKKTGPVEVAEYSILLMLSTRGKCYSFQEMEQVLTSVGFKDIHTFSTAGFRSLITARKPNV
jgi:hypothetical protein